MKEKKIWICGVGGVGGYFGGLIAHSISLMKEKTHEVFFLARGEHLKVIQEKGLELHTSDGKVLICKPSMASDDINNFPTPDLCIVCVKSYDLDALIKKIKDIIIPLMNGIDIYERIRANLERAIVLPTCVYVGTYRKKPGVVIQSGNPGFFECGPDPLYPNFKPTDFLTFFNQIEIGAHWTQNPEPAIWKKYLLVASFALVTAHTGQTLGSVINSNSIKILREIMSEIVSIAKKKGIDLPDKIIDETIEFCKDYSDVKTSYQRDVENGKKNEGELFGGTIIKLGKKFGIPTPMTEKIYKVSD